VRKKYQTYEKEQRENLYSWRTITLKQLSPNHVCEIGLIITVVICLDQGERKVKEDPAFCFARTSFISPKQSLCLPHREKKDKKRGKGGSCKAVLADRRVGEEPIQEQQKWTSLLIFFHVPRSTFSSTLLFSCYIIFLVFWLTLTVSSFEYMLARCRAEYCSLFVASGLDLEQLHPVTHTPTLPASSNFG
jgi:hypothetical protein